MKLTKEETKRHDEALALLAKERLHPGDEEFVFEHYHPGANHNVGANGVFFTPVDLANDLSVFSKRPGKGKTRFMDLCAGIGVLTYHLLQTHGWPHVEGDTEYVCIELNPTFVEVGKTLVPQATWICADIFDEGLWRELGIFTFGVSNPPFGHTKKSASTKWLGFKGDNDLMVAELIYRHCESGGILILPQTSTPFKYSGSPGFQQLKPDCYADKLKRFFKANPDVTMSCGSVDTSYYNEQWKGVAPRVELVELSYPERGLSACERVTQPVALEVASGARPNRKTRQPERLPSDGSPRPTSKTTEVTQTSLF
jgi:hypothetical protein